MAHLSKDLSKHSYPLPTDVNYKCSLKIDQALKVLFGIFLNVYVNGQNPIINLTTLMVATATTDAYKLCD